jgi:hypothetical protein
MNTILPTIVLIIFFGLLLLFVYAFFRIIKYFVDRYYNAVTEISKKADSTFNKISATIGIILIFLVSLYFFTRLIHFFWMTDISTMVRYIVNLINY